MLRIIRTSLRTGRVTEAYPAESTARYYRGRPKIDPARCDFTAACAASCPSRAITISQKEDGGQRWQMDLARCVFCGLCAEACPNGAITVTGEFELATHSRDDLIVGVTRAPAAVMSRTPSPPPVAAGDSRNDRPDIKDGCNKLSNRLRSLLKRSLHIRHMAAGSDNSCDWEIAHLLNPVYDVQRLGIDFVASPRHADLLLVTGAVTRNLEIALYATYQAMPSPRLVVAVGDEACGGGVLQGSYAVAGGVDRCLPVDVYVPGDPPRPQAIIQGLLIALDRLEPRVRRVEMVGRPTAPAPR
ncbi:MAG: 4Fe-4S dicluster domain-containing protein [Chloroflexi bacterium]|nr:4Fe-4S dicluster domain-containing protein [Chloroflexota bacterium]